MDISVIVPALNERDNLRALIPRLHDLFSQLRVSSEVLVVDGGSSDGGPEIARELGARVLRDRRKGYAGALEEGFAQAQGDYVLTLDADMSHEPGFVAKMWRVRDQADVTIASRYVRGGVAYTSWARSTLSKLLNRALRVLLALDAKDISSGFRLYRHEVVDAMELESRDIEVLEEILVKASCRGFTVQEVPFTYFPRGEGRSHSRVIQFGIQIVRSALKHRALRNSVDSADFAERAFYSLSPIRRFRERRRHRLIIGWARGAGLTLHVGCGSSMVIRSLNNAVGVDADIAKLRYLRRHDLPLFRGVGAALPFKDETFDCVILTDSIASEAAAGELQRVLRHDGTAIISATTRSESAYSLLTKLEGHSLEHQETVEVGRGMLMRCRKTQAVATAHSRQRSQIHLVASR